MKRILSITAVLLILALTLHAQTLPNAAPNAAPNATKDADKLTRLLNDFLDGASRNDAAMHDRFWAEDLIYTGSSGRRIGKADILRGLRSAPAPKPGDPKTTYTAEEIRIQQYGETAIVAFRLVGATEQGDKTEVMKYLNTGTFLKRNDVWQAVSWQATKLPTPEEEAKKAVAAIEAGFHQALLASYIKKLESVMDESFIWTHDAGEQVTRLQLIERLTSGRLK